jgi:signal transduction histidine kinase/ActR/RegA family two-component response regulator
LLKSRGPERVIIRRLLPAAILIPIVAAVLRLAGQRAGLYGLETGIIILVGTCILLLVTVVFWGAGIVRRTNAERQRLEEQLIYSDKMATIGTISTSIAHEINNPLSFIIGNIDLSIRDLNAMTERIVDDPFDNVAHAESLQSIRDSLKDAREGAARIRKIAGDMKTLAHPNNAEAELVHLDLVVEAAVRIAWPEIQPRARLEKEHQPTPPVFANASRLGQVFINLLINGAQAIPPGRASENRLAVKTRAGENGEAVAEISDTGCGIAHEVRDRLFTPFFTTKPPGVGTGLGLSICRSIVSSYGGRIDVESEPGQGTTFRVSLPPAAVATTGRPESTGMSPMFRDAQLLPQAAGHRARVLVIDDDALVAKSMTRILRRDYDVTTAGSGHEALAILATSEPFAVITCDIMMPGMTGIEFFETLRGSSPEQADRVVFITGGTFPGAAGAFFESRRNRCLNKPLDAELLSKTIHEVVSSAANN